MKTVHVEKTAIPGETTNYERAEKAESEVERLSAEVEQLKGAEERCETWKAQAGRDQQENRVLKARLAGNHATNPGRDVPDSFSVPQLVQFLRVAARNAKDGKWGMWRAKEFEQAADALDEMRESYLAVCFHETENNATQDILEAVRALPATWRNLAEQSRRVGQLTMAQAYRRCADELEAALAQAKQKELT